jgi:WD40 repeat protein
VEAPPFGAVQARKRHRLAAQSGVATVVALVVAIVAMVAINDRNDNDSTAIRTVDTTRAPRPSSTTDAPSKASTPTTTAAPPVATTTAPATPTTTTPTTATTVPHAVLAVTGSPPGNAVAVGDDGSLVRLRTDNGKVTKTLTNKFTAAATFRLNNITDAAMAADGRIFSAYCCKPTVGTVFDWRTRSAQPRLQGATTTAHPSVHGTTPAVSPDGRYLAIDNSKRIEIFNLESGKKIRTIDASHAGAVVHLAMANDGRVALDVRVQAHPPRRAIVLLSAAATTTNDVADAAGWEYGSATDPTFMPDGGLVYVDRHIDESGTTTGMQLRLLNGSNGNEQELTGDLLVGVLDLAVSPTGYLLVTCSDHVVRSFDGTTWRDVARGYTAADW